MVKKKFVECQLAVLAFDRKEIIETSSFEGVVDEFYTVEGNPVNGEGGAEQS